jgi:hypothetical protein
MLWRVVCETLRREFLLSPPSDVLKTGGGRASEYQRARALCAYSVIRVAVGEHEHVPAVHVPGSELGQARSRREAWGSSEDETTARIKGVRDRQRGRTFADLR